MMQIRLQNTFDPVVYSVLLYYYSYISGPADLWGRERRKISNSRSFDGKSFVSDSVEIQEGKYPCPYFRRPCIKADIQKQYTVDSCHVAFWRKKSQENSSQTFILCPPRLFCLFSVCTIGKICCIITMNCPTQSQLDKIVFEVESLLLQFSYSKKAQNF